MFRIVMLLIISGIITQSKVKAQNVDQTLLWLRYNQHVQWNENWQTNLEIEERRYALPDRAHQRLLPRFSLERNFNDKLYLSAGFTYFQAFAPQDPLLPATLQNEYRPHQYIKFKHKRGKWKFEHRLMLEQRLQESSNGNLFSFRGRLLNSVSFIFLEGISAYEKSNLGISLQNETMLHTGAHIQSEYFDQTRIYLGASSRLSPHWGMDLGGMIWLQNQAGNDIFFRRLITRFTIHHYFAIKHD